MIIDKKKARGQERILAEHLDGLERNDFCHFDKPRKRAYQKKKIKPTSKKQGGRPAKTSLWKKAGCQTESKALEKGGMYSSRGPSLTEDWQTKTN